MRHWAPGFLSLLASLRFDCSAGFFLVLLNMTGPARGYSYIMVHIKRVLIIRETRAHQGLEFYRKRETTTVTITEMAMFIAQTNLQPCCVCKISQEGKPSCDSSSCLRSA